MRKPRAIRATMEWPMLRRTLFVVMALLTPLSARAGGELDRIRARGRLIVSAKNDAHKAHRDPAHFQKRGFEVELAHKITAHILGDESRVELRNLARPVRLPMVAQGAVDLAVSMIPVTTENQRQCDFSHPYFASGLSLLMPAAATPLSLGALDGKTIAFRKQSYNDYGAELARIAGERGVKLTVRYYGNFDEAVAAVARGEAAAMGGNFVDLDTYRKDHAGLTVNDKLLEQRLVAVAVKKGNDELLRVVNETIDELRRSGELKRMTDRWHLPYLLPAS
jgi:aspartate/glutamate/glutamine transport system substrate-binding protein